MKEVYIHVGYPKCASTFLQRNVFPYMNVHLISKFPDNIYNSEHHDYTAISKIKEGKNLITNEQLTGNAYRNMNYASGFDIIDRLKLLYPDAGIILVRRDKDKWLKSLYKQFCSDTKKAKFVSSYQDWYDNHLEHDLLRFDEYEEKVRKLFDRTLVIWFEDFCRDNDRAIKQICDFIGIEFPYNYDRTRRNVALNDNQLKFVKLSGKLGIHLITDKYVLALFRRMNSI